MNLYQTYGYCIVPKGFELFRRADTTEIYSNMFFAFDTAGTTSANCESNDVQVWETIIDIQALFMVKEVKKQRKISALPDIYKYYFPDDNSETIDDLTLKHRDTKRRQSIIKVFRNQGITAWVTSVENKVGTELFLFAPGDQNKDLVQFKDYRDASINIDNYNNIKIINNQP